MQKNLFRLAIILVMAALGIFWLELGWFAAILVIMALMVFELIIIAFFPIVNIRHKVQHIINAPVGVKICVTPFTRTRFNYYLEEYTVRLRDQPVKITLPIDGTIELEKV